MVQMGRQSRMGVSYWRSGFYGAQLVVLLIGVTASVLLLAADRNGIRCTIEDGDKINPAYMQPRPVLLQLPNASGRFEEFDLSPELIVKIVDAQAPEFLISRVQGRVIRRLQEMPSLGAPKT